MKYVSSIKLVPLADLKLNHPYLYLGLEPRPEGGLIIHNSARAVIEFMGDSGLNTIRYEGKGPIYNLKGTVVDVDEEYGQTWGLRLIV